MFSGTHLLLYSTDSAADRGFLRDVLGFKYVDIGQGWLIFQLPPAEVGVHPYEGPYAPPQPGHGTEASSGISSNGEPPEPAFALATVWLMCTDITATMKILAESGVSVA